MNTERVRHWMLAPVVALGIGLTAPQMAAAAGYSTLPPFSFVDEDGDRKISRAEARSEPSIRQQFEALDSNRDGALTRLEYLDAGRARHHERTALPSGAEPAVDVPLSGTLLR